MYRVERNDIMSAEKDKLFTANGGRRPFTVPDGYFDGLAGQVMSRIDAVEQKDCVRVSLWAKARKWVAACACVAIVAGAVAYAGFGRHEPHAGAIAVSHSVNDVSASYSSVDMAADYTMLDTDDMYAMMSMSN